MEQKVLTVKDFEDLGVVFAYQEYGGVCTISGALTKDKPNMALSLRNHVRVSFDEEWHDEKQNNVFLMNTPTPHEYNENQKVFKGFVNSKEDLIKAFEQIGIRIKEDSRLEEV